MRRVAVLLLLAAGLPAQAPRTAAAVTEPGRTLTRPLDMVLGGTGSEPAERTVVVVLDPTPGLRDAGFADAFSAALARNAATLSRTRLGLAVVGGAFELVVEPTTAHAQVAAAVRQRVQRPGQEFVNVYAGLREAGEVAARGKGERVVLLVSLENGDLEDEVEKTVKQLEKDDVRVDVLTSESTLSDSYWAARPYQEKPRGTELVGGDGAVTELPWGFVLQRTPANELTPSAYAPWGLTRVAEGTGGRVFLHATSSQTAHECLPFGTCLFCDRDHASPLDEWNTALVAQLAPLAESRADTFRELGQDPVFRALIKTWTAAARAGLVRSAPAVKVSTTSARPDRQREGRDLRLFDTANFARNAKRAEEGAKEAAELRDRLADQLDALGDAGAARSRAAARYTVVLLQLTRVNLLIYAGWCREIAPRWFDGDGDDAAPPEVPPFDVERRPSGVSFHNLALCHGVRPFFDVELPGGEVVTEELKRLDALFNGYLHRYGKSQFGHALRRNGIARFHPTYPGISRGPVRRRPKSENDQRGPLTPKRPARRGGGSTGAGGPTTGGGG